MKQVRETKAGRSISAWVVLKDGKEIGIIQAHYADSGGVTVDVFQYGKPATKSYRSAVAVGQKIKDKSYVDSEYLPWQQGHASGYGYDKFTAALSRLWIDGHKMLDHGEGKSAGIRRLEELGYTVIQAI